jgi:hypothetical protein
MSEYLQTKFRGERVAIHGKRSGMVFFLNLHDLDSTTPSCFACYIILPPAMSILSTHSTIDFNESLTNISLPEERKKNVQAMNLVCRHLLFRVITTSWIDDLNSDALGIHQALELVTTKASHCDDISVVFTRNTFFLLGKARGKYFIDSATFVWLMIKNQKPEVMLARPFSIEVVTMLSFILISTILNKGTGNALEAVEEKDERVPCVYNVSLQYWCCQRALCTLNNPRGARSQSPFLDPSVVPATLSYFFSLHTLAQMQSTNTWRTTYLALQLQRYNTNLKILLKILLGWGAVRQDDDIVAMAYGFLLNQTLETDSHSSHHDYILLPSFSFVFCACHKKYHFFKKMTLDLPQHRNQHCIIHSIQFQVSFPIL